MIGFWERAGELLGRIVIGAAYLALMATVGGLPTIYVILHAIATVILAFVCIFDEGGKVKMVFYAAAAVLMVGSAAAYHFTLMGSGGVNNALANTFFAISAAKSFFIWFGIAKVDSVFSWVDLVVCVAGGLLGLFFNSIEKPVIIAVIFLIIGLVFVALVPIFRFAILRETAFDDCNSWKMGGDYEPSDRGSSGRSSDGAKIRALIDGSSISVGGGKYGRISYGGSGDIKVAMNGGGVMGWSSADKNIAINTIENELSNNGLSCPNITFWS